MPRKQEQRIGVGDIETDPFKAERLYIEPFCCGFFDGKTVLTWWGKKCIADMMTHIRKKFVGVIYFHNGGNFDFHFLLEYMPVNDCEFLCMGKRIVQIKTPWGVEFRDSFAIIPKKLASYEKEEIDYKLFEADKREKHRDAILKYLRSDLTGLAKMISGFLARFPQKLTLASSVFDLMKNEYDYNPGRSEASYDEKFRPFFFGGRVEFWKLGPVTGKFRIVDINSAYPWGMTNPHWFGFESKCVHTIPKKFREQSLYIVTGNAQGCFPVRAKNGGVEFPSGEGKFFVTGWELMAAIDLKLVTNLKVLIAYVPEKICDISKFSNTLYDRKLAAKNAGDKEEEFFNKIAVNAGYGKLALNPTKFSEVKVTTIYDKPEDGDGEKWKNCWHDKDRGLSFWKRSNYREGIDTFVNVATAASITGCVRAFLLRSIHACGGAAYCDTDSLILSDPGALSMGDKLGQWKDELSIDSNRFGEIDGKKQRSGLWIAGKKLYAAFGQEPSGKWKWKIASKGVKLSPERIISVATGKTETMIFDAPTYSLFSPPKFVSRDVRRADKRISR
jgi:hypothetical protein